MREKDLTEKEYKDLAEKVLAICKEYQVPCILHTFYQVAMELPCDGLHLPLPLLREVTAGKSASGRWREKFAKLGTSVHSVEEAIEAEKLGATYITAGHVYATDCKKGLPPRGLLFLREVCEAVDISVYGIGGIKFHMGRVDRIGKMWSNWWVYHVWHDENVKNRKRGRGFSRKSPSPFAVAPVPF